MASRDASPRALAVAVVDRALELYGAREPDRRLDEALLADPGVQAIFDAGSIPFDSEALTRLAIVLAREVIGVWSGVYPDSKAPLAALEAAEAWAACPCISHAESAAEAAPAAIFAFGAVWSRPPKEAAWAGRTAAWVGHAPKYGWQAVTAITGACRATSPERVTSAAARFFAGEVGGCGRAHE